jgi:hypothetical protein
MSLDLESMPTRGQFTSTADYERALQAWQARNTLPAEKIVQPTGGDIHALQVRKPSGAYGSHPPRP